MRDKDPFRPDKEVASRFRHHGSTIDVVDFDGLFKRKSYTQTPDSDSERISFSDNASLPGVIKSLDVDLERSDMWGNQKFEDRPFDEFYQCLTATFEFHEDTDIDEVHHAFLKRFPELLKHMGDVEINFLFEVEGRPLYQLIDTETQAEFILEGISSHGEPGISNHLDIDGDDVLTPPTDEQITIEYVEKFTRLAINYAEFIASLGEDDEVRHLRKYICLHSDAEAAQKYVDDFTDRFATARQGMGRAALVVPNDVEAQIAEGEFGQKRVSFEDIGGLQDIKDQLGDVVLSFQHPEVMEKWGVERPQAVMFYGEPGTGKTMLAQALAAEIGADFVEKKATDVFNMYVGNSAKNMQKIFDDAKKYTHPTILFLDEFESFSSGAGNESVQNSVNAVIKTEMNTLRRENPQVIIVAAVNDKEKIDTAVQRSGRFDMKLYIPLPNDEARKDIFIKLITKGVGERVQDDTADLFSEDLDVFELARLTDGKSGADLTEILRRARLKKAMYEARTGIMQPISHTDIVDEIKIFSD